MRFFASLRMTVVAQFIGLICLINPPNFAYCDEIEISATVDKNVVALDEQVQFQIIISGNVGSLPSIKLPEITNFTTYSAGSSQNVSFINGQVSSSVTYTYILTPKSVGKFTIPAMSINFKGKNYTTSPINIEVVKQSSKPQAGPKERQAEPTEHGKRDIFVDAVVDKKQAYVNEQIVYTFRFYRRIQLLSNPEYASPDFTGFWTEDLPPHRQSYVTLDGKRYLVTEVKTALFPTHSGKYTIKGARLKCDIKDFSKGDFNDFFSDFFSRGTTKVLETDPIAIDIKPLAEEGKPKNFEGAVGKYTITAEVDKKSVKAYEPVTLKITIAGTGNIKTMPKLNLPELTSFKKYETVSSLNITKEDDRVKGSQVYTTVIVPQISGKLTIPEISFSFFDPIEKKYKAVESSPIYLDIKPGEKETLISASQIERNGTKILGRDIRHIKNLGKLEKEQKPLYKNKVFLLLQFIPILSLIGTWQYQRRKEHLSRNISLVKRRRSFQKAMKELKKAESLLKSNDAKTFSTMLSCTITGFVADKLNLAAAGLTIKQIEDILKDKKVKEEITGKVSRILEQLDFVRFAPSNYGTKEMEELFDSTKTILRELENEKV